MVYLCLASSLQAQSLSPEITNYAFGSSQNWGVDITSDGRVAVANNSGLSIYNGQFWTLYELPNKMIVRSVFSDGNRIFTGSYEEFGYWEENLLGEHVYFSLKENFGKDKPLQGEEFWQIVKFNDTIFFRSFGAIYAFNGSKINRIATSSNISGLCVYKDKLLFSSLDTGLNEINNTLVVPYEGNEKIASFNEVTHVVSFDDLIFLNTRQLGAFLYNGIVIQKLPVNLNKALKNFTLNKISFGNKNQIVFGTVKNGIIIYNIQNQTFKILNKQSGLRNNTILDLKIDNNYLWLALDNGISKIDIKSNFLYFTDLTGVLGTVYDVAFFQNKYYLASNTGVYTFEDNLLKLINDSEGHSWNLFKFENKLFCAHNNGAFIIRDKKLVPIKGSFSGVYNYFSRSDSNDLFLSTYSGIGVLKTIQNEYVISKLDGLDVPIDKLVFENDSTLWATDNYKGLYKVLYDKRNSIVNKINRFSGHPMIKDHKVELEELNGKPYFLVNGNWYTYSKINDRFQPVGKFYGKKLLGKKSSKFWLFDNTKSIISCFNYKLELEDDFSNKFLFSRFVRGYEKLIYKNDSTVVFNLKDGFSVLSLNNKAITLKSKPIIHKVFVNRELIDNSLPNNLELKHKDARLLTLEVFTPGAYENILAYNLNGEVNLNEDIQNGRFTFQNLPAGNYNLEVYDKGSPFLKTTLQIKVLPPWYLSLLMKIVYVILLLFVIYFVARYQKHQAKKDHLKVQMHLKEEARKKLEQVEKNNLINEIKTRKKELTNRTASIVQKNETIILLRNELKRLEKSSPNLTRTKNILHRSGEQLDSKNDWTLFETKFNELNEDFFKSLSMAFPKLTTKDRKLCAYIKVGLTSKEIAPLLGITTRSVELQRYRLRKKLNLDAQITFIEFLDQF
ncbi:helix-turn-helix and ligand-binding sensor domain-containing protein [Aurantibacter aestuarii]|uniref:HTH luxR-type domain-containing protein n=1 Tax=Aurantibacter aestuarii TaxID=1266046 RepID=A0A2T1NC64_9FLAO|nr:LuxR C-terminal-related transcriptional regulator [Aurantibacter aestuarii]PSG90030.1 hypothetical protein C7H52_01800 [Aurantibacter aestuarii]